MSVLPKLSRCSFPPVRISRARRPAGLCLGGALLGLPCVGKRVRFQRQLVSPTLNKQEKPMLRGGPRGHLGGLYHSDVLQPDGDPM